MRNYKKILVILLVLVSLFMVACDLNHQHEYIDGVCSCGAEEERFVVTFDTKGGTLIDSVKVVPGKTIKKPANPQKEGCSFVAWMYQGIEWNFEEDVVTSDIILEACYQDTFKLTLIGVDGEIISELDVKYGDYVSLTETYGDKSVYWEYCNDTFTGAITFNYLCDVELQMHISEDYTYNIFSNVALKNWSGLKEQTDSEKELYSYINDSLFAFDYQFDSKGNIIDGDYEVEYSAAKEVVDITNQYAGLKNGWDIPTGAENQVYKITLREDLRWDDGTCIKAEDFVYSMRELLNPLFKNQNAEKFYDGKVVIKNAYNYFHQGLSGMYAANNIYKEYSEDLDSELVFSVGNQQNGTSYINSWASSLLGYSSSAPLYEIVYLLNQYGFGLNEYTISLMEGKTLAEIKADVTLKAEWDKIINLWKAEPNDELHFFIVEYSYPEITDDKLGIFVGENEYEFIIVLDKPVALFTEDCSLSYKVINDLPVLPLFKKDLYESCKIAPSSIGGLWQNNYGTGVETTASWGPYKLVSYENDSSYTLEKNKNWYGYDIEANEELYQTTHIVCEVIYDPFEAINQLLAGKLDNIVLDTARGSEYVGNNHSYYMMTNNVTVLNLQSNKEKLEARESEGINKTMLSYADFRKALSLAIDRLDFILSTKIVGNSALGLFNSINYNDVENGSVYRNTEEAKKALCDVYGVDVSQYNSLDEAYETLTGYDLEKAKDLVRSAYAQALADGEIDEDDVVELTFGAAQIFETNIRRHNYIKEAWIELVKDTPLEGRLKFSFDLELGTSWSYEFRAGNYDVCISEWIGSEWNPGYLLLAYLSPDYMYSTAWDTSNTMMTFTMKGAGENGADITETMSLLEWYDCLNGNPGRYDWSSNALDESIRVQLIAALEKEVLESGYTIPLYSFGNLGLISDQIEFPTYEYNTFVKFGGVKYIAYNYDDDVWEEMNNQ